MAERCLHTTEAEGPIPSSPILTNMKHYSVKRVFIIHGYKSYPTDCWFPWLKKKLVQRCFTVSVPRLPNPSKPTMKQWVRTIKQIIGKPDKDTYFIGHSLGAIAIIRYLETLKDEQKIGGFVSVGGRVIRRPVRKATASFFESPVSWNRVKRRVKHVVGIYSTDDTVVSLQNGKELKKKLGARLVLENKKGHFDRETGVFKPPSVLQALLDISNE